jgi:hypothetical protein
LQHIQYEFASAGLTPQPAALPAQPPYRFSGRSDFTEPFLLFRSASTSTIPLFSRKSNGNWFYLRVSYPVHIVT